MNCAASSCTFSGKPTGSGSFPFNLSVTDSGAHAGNRNFTINIAASCVFCDDFESGVISNSWTILKPSWAESNGEMVGTSGKGKSAIVSTSGGCSLCTIEATLSTAGGIRGKIWLLGWYQDNKNMVQLLMKEDTDRWVLKQMVDGHIVAKGKAPLHIDPNTPYDVKIQYDGTNFTLSIDGSPVIVLQAIVSPFGTVGMQVKNTTGSYGFVLVQ